MTETNAKGKNQDKKSVSEVAKGKSTYTGLNRETESYAQSLAGMLHKT